MTTLIKTLRTTLLTNVFNEEYLLPFWLQHHKDMFDDIIIVDYKSTDASIEICKRICPGCKIITTRNANFDAEQIDIEFMDLEKDIEGIKIVLNTTEFLFCEKEIKDIFIEFNDPTSLSVNAVSPYSNTQYQINNLHELKKCLLNKDVFYHNDRGCRQIHNFKHGNYSIGRHGTNNPTVQTNDMHIIWFGYYPFNERLLNRKLQIKQHVPQTDTDKGFGGQHLYTKEQMMHINSYKSFTGVPFEMINARLYNLLKSQCQNKTFIVTGGCGFIGSHMVDKLIELGHNVIVFDNLLSGSLENTNKGAIIVPIDICNFGDVNNCISSINVRIDGIFHFAAIARTPWCIDDPILCYNTNVMGTLNILEAARKHNIKRVVLSSSNVVYAFHTPYRTSKEALESLATTYNQMYGLSVIALRYSNVYGKRQSENGPSPNVFAALRKSKKELGKLIITGDGTQTRNYTHVSDIVMGNLLSMFHNYCGVIDLCTGVSVPLNEVAKYFNCPVEYIDERPGDVKHIIQSPDKAYEILGWKALTTLEEGIADVL
jgi:UDP-glucose 4-epimerase